jgi:hypothetical protein
MNLVLVMSEPNPKLIEAYALLQDSRAQKREAGAKKLRKLNVPETGEALFQALQKELRDKRTWSAQYNLIIAIGVVGCEPALPFLWELAGQKHDAAILYMALGDAIFRLSLQNKSVREAWQEVLQTQNPRLLYGALRAIAMLKLVPDDEIVRDIMAVAEQPEFVDSVRGHLGDKTGLRYWVVLASANWRPELVRDFLLRCQVVNTTLRLNVEDVLKGKLIKTDY